MPQIDCCNICFLTLAMHYLNNSSSFREMVSSKSSCLTILSLFSPSLQHQCTLSSFSNPFAIYSHHTFSQALTSSLPRMIVIICLLKFQVCTSTVSPTLLPRALAEFLININKATSVFSLKNLYLKFTSAMMLQIWLSLANSLSCCVNYLTLSQCSLTCYLLNYKVYGAGIILFCVCMTPDPPK